MGDFTYETNCVSSKAKYLIPMVDQARQITWETFRKHVRLEEVKRIFPDYSYRGENINENGELTIGFHIKDDWAVSFWKSKFRHRTCYYIDHSGIEYIFTEPFYG